MYFADLTQANFSILEKYNKNEDLEFLYIWPNSMVTK